MIAGQPAQYDNTPGAWLIEEGYTLTERNGVVMYPYLLPELLHDDINKLLLNAPRLVHGAQVRRSHTVGHQQGSRGAASSKTTRQASISNRLSRVKGRSSVT